MPAKRYRVRLTPAERKELDREVNTGTGSAQRLRRARILLMADEAQAGGGWIDADIAKALGATSRTVERIREKCVTAGMKPLSTTSDRSGSGRGSWMARAKRAWCSWRAALRPLDRSSGRCRCWPISWSN